MDKSSCGGILIQYAGVLGEAFCFEHLPSLPLQCVCPLNCVVRREEE